MVRGVRASHLKREVPVRLCFRLISLVITLGLVPSVFAQISTATLTGRVTDSTGAVVAGAQITVTSAETQFRSVAQTNSEGLYRVQSLLPGTYQVSCESSGFKRSVQLGITLRVGSGWPAIALGFPESLPQLRLCGADQHGGL